MSEPPTPIGDAPAPAPLLDLRGAAIRLVQGSALYATANFGIKSLNFLLVPVYTRYLTPSEYGIINLAESLAAMVAIFAGVGLTGAVRRLYFEYVDDAGALARYMSTNFYFLLVAGSLAFALSCIGLKPALTRWDPGIATPFFRYLVIAVATAVVSLVAEFRLVGYQLEQKPRAYALLAVAQFLLMVIASLLLVVVWRWGALGMLLGKCIAATVAGLIAIMLLRRWLFAGWSAEYLRKTLSLSLPIIPHQLMAFGLIAADRFILQRYRPLSEVGIYTLAYTFGMVMLLVTSSLMQAWNPLFFDVARQGTDNARAILGRLSSALIIFLAAIACFGSLIAEDVTRAILSPAYRAVGPVIPWIIGGYFFHGLFGLFHLSILQGKRTSLLLAASGIACAANIGLNFWWIPKWGMYGAAYATFVGYVIEAAIMYVAAQKVHRVPYQQGRILLSLAVFFSALMLTQIPFQQVPHPVIMLGGIVVCGSLFVLVGRRELLQIMEWLYRGRLGLVGETEQ